MNNLFLVIKREYITRVRRKSFILATLLTPIGFAILAIVANFIFSYGSDEVQRIAVIDEGGIFTTAVADEKGIFFKFEDGPEEELVAQIGKEDGYTGVLVAPAVKNLNTPDYRVRYIGDEALSLNSEIAIQRRVEKALRNYKINELRVDRDVLDKLDTDVKVRSSKLGDDGETSDSSFATVMGTAIGSIMGFIMYISVFVYGMMIMRSVMEEKTNRIVEVVISSVKPFTLLLGKIIGVGALGLTQILVWMIMIPGLLFAVSLLFGFDADTAQNIPNSPEVNPEEVETMMEKVSLGIASLNWWFIIPAFLAYFLGGYFIYAALFAAVGSAIGDDMGESSSLTLPISIPVIIAFYIMTATLQSPNSSLAVWSSIFPLFSPIVMPARLAFGPPVWQVALSITLMILFALAMIWVAGRIYRVGILSYGKKSSLSEMGKWIFSKY